MIISYINIHRETELIGSIIRQASLVFLATSISQLYQLLEIPLSFNINKELHSCPITCLFVSGLH